MQKRGQHWSIEVLVSVSLFIVFFVGAIGLLAIQSQSATKDVARDSGVLVNQLYGNEDEILVLVKDGKLDTNRIIELAALTDDQRKDLVGIKSDFCILVRNPQTGALIPLDNGSGPLTKVVGVGSSSINISGTPCGSFAP